MKIKYCILFLFLSIIILGQTHEDLIYKEKYKLKFDSIFIKSFGQEFFKKSVKYNQKQSFISVDTLDINSEDYLTTNNFFVNEENIKLLSKFNNKNYNITYMYYYTFQFLFKRFSFYQDIYRYDFSNNTEQLNFENKKILNYYDKLKNNVYLNPKKILKLAKSIGLKNICYQSLTEYSYYHKGEIIWVVKSCDDNKKITILDR